MTVGKASGRVAKRRRMLDTSEEYVNSDGYTIEAWCSVNDPYRVAPGAHIVHPFPFSMRASSLESGGMVDGLKDKIRQILKNYNITPLNISVYNFYVNHNRADKDTLVITTHDELPANEADETVDSSWKYAAGEIYTILVEAGEKIGVKMRLEIRNPDKMIDNVNYIVRPGTPEHKALEALAPAVSLKVREICSDWVSICYLMRGCYGCLDGDKKPTVLVTFRPGTRQLWYSIFLQLSEVIQAESPKEVEVYLELFPGTNYSATDYTWKIPQRYMTRIPENGSSIGPRNGPVNSGTLGTFVKWTPENGQTREMFLTACHVVTPGAPLGRQESIKKNGIGLNQAKVEVADQILIDYPSPTDAIATKELTQKAIDENSPSKHDYRRILRLIDEVKDGGGLGMVNFGSGESKLGNKDCRMDWALIRLRDSKYFGKNKLPTKKLKPFELGTVSWHVSNHETITEIGEPVEGTWALMRGRTAEVATGEVTSIKSEIYNKYDGTSSHETTIVGLDGYFASMGDSGSMVIDEKKRWIGMVIAAAPSSSHGLAFISHASDIMADIEKRTKGVISLS